MPFSRLDHVYRKVILTKFFTRGWGKPRQLQDLIEFRKLLGNREKCITLVDPNHEIIIDKIRDVKDFHIIDGHLRSPLADHLPGFLPPPAEIASFQFIVPQRWTTKDKPVCVHTAGTGDHGFWRRRNLIALPLLRNHSIASLLLENPFYGSRKPSEQIRSNLLNVTDIFVMGGGLILELLAILHWLEKNGYGPLGLHGISMGGHMASLAATNWPKPLPLIACLSWTTASGVFTKGVLSDSIDWKILQHEYYEHKYYDEISKVLNDNYDKAYLAGKNFAHNFPLPEDSKYDGLNKADDFQDIAAKILTDLKRIEHDKLSRDVLFNPRTSIVSRVTRKIEKAVSRAKRTTLEGQLTLAALRDRIETMSDRRVDGSESHDIVRETAGRDALQFMRGIMDECTHIKNFSTPIDPELIIVVAASDDAYVPRDEEPNIADVWPGCDIRYIDCGHISAYILHQNLFRKAIVDGFEKYRDKYNNDGTPKSNL